MAIRRSEFSSVAKILPISDALRSFASLGPFDFAQGQACEAPIPTLASRSPIVPAHAALMLRASFSYSTSDSAGRRTQRV